MKATKTSIKVIKKIKWTVTVMLFSVFAWMALGASGAWADPADTDVSIAFSKNPATDGDLVTITGTVLCDEVHGAFCTVVDKPVTIGSLRIQERKVVGGTIDQGVSCGTAGLCTAGGFVGSTCSTNADCDSILGAGDGICTLAGFVDISSGLPDANGQRSINFDTAGLGGSIIGFHTHYVTDGGSHVPGTGNSPCLDLVIEEVECTSPISITATAASGNGTPMPGENINLAYIITVTACEGATGVFAQGGNNGWSNFVNAYESIGDWGFHKKSKAIRWSIGDMYAPQEESIEVMVNATIKDKQSECGKVKNLNGPWSATYSIDGGATFQKSDYTGQVSVTVTCP